MALNIADYLDEVSFKYLTGHATEHSYRPALEALFRSISEFALHQRRRFRVHSRRSNW